MANRNYLNILTAVSNAISPFLLEENCMGVHVPFEFHYGNEREKYTVFVEKAACPADEENIVLFHLAPINRVESIIMVKGDRYTTAEKVAKMFHTYLTRD